MTIHVSFPSIEQYRNTVKKVRDRAQHNSLPIPTIRFRGTVKLHGTNAAVCSYVDNQSPIWAQSRSNVITVENDNAGFARFVEDNRFDFDGLIFLIRNYIQANQKDVISIYGEWCGQGIQKGVAISQLPKMFVIFAVSVSDITNIQNDGNVKYNWYDLETLENTIFDGFKPKNPQIKFIYNFDTWAHDIDFTQPEKDQNILGKLTEEVERRCPVGAALGSEGTGEGIVWVAEYAHGDVPFRIDDLTFKVKGEKHSVTRVKTLANVDIEKVNSIKEFVDSVLTEARLNQGIQSLKEQGLEPVVENTGAFLKWIGADIIKEESDTMESNGLGRPEVMPVVNREARQWFMKQQLKG